MSHASNPLADPLLEAGSWHGLLDAVRDAFPARLDTTNPSLALTRVVVEAAEHLKHPARPIPVFVDIARGSGAHTRREGGIDERALLQTPLGWAGHLVALVDLGPEQRVLLDASADRFDRPIRNLIIGGPVAVSTSGGAALACIRPHHGHDTTVTYRLMPSTHPGRDGWNDSPWWRPGSHADATAIRAAETAAIRAAETTVTPAPHTGKQAYNPASSLPKTHPKAG